VTTHWFIAIEGDVEADVYGPFNTSNSRDDAALEWLRDNDEPLEREHGMHWLDIDDRGVPTVGDYSGGFFTEVEQ
jgi:hypothetical protein